MHIQSLHPWDLTPAAAVALQRQLAGRVIRDTPLEQARLIAGADVSYNQGSDVFYGGVVVLKAEDLSVVERRGAVARNPFPYVPGLLSFREIPILLEAFARLEHTPDLVLYDGHGIAHPRRLGIAAHLGLWLDLPCIGCAKTRLTGKYAEPALPAGSRSELIDRKEVVGTVLRPRTGVKPLFVSVGHRIDLDSAVRWVLACGAGYRLPEPTRLADQYVNALRRGEVEV
jgi:deoxyribonuclease V